MCKSTKSTVSIYFYSLVLCLLLICVSTNDAFEIPIGETVNVYRTPATSSSFKYFNSRADAASMFLGNQYEHASKRNRPPMQRYIPIELQKALYAHGIVGRRR